MRHSEQTLRYFHDRARLGPALADGQRCLQGRAGRQDHGACVELWLIMAAKRQKGAALIASARFLALGSVATLASCAWLTEWLEGRSLQEAARLSVETIQTALGLNRGQRHAVSLVKYALNAAIASDTPAVNALYQHDAD